MATTTTTDIKFSCASCGKEYRWKPELAGKQAKCKCGATITVPKTPPPPPVPRQEEVGLDGLYALAQEEKKAGARLAAADPEAAGARQGYRCPSCGNDLPVGATVCPNCSMDMKTGRKRAAQGARSNGVAAASAGFATSKRGGASGKALSIKGGKYDEPKTRGFADFSKTRDIYLPAGLVAAGVIVYVIQMVMGSAGDSETEAFGRKIVLVSVITDVFLMFVAMMIAVKFLDMAFGGLGPAILKLFAISLGPGAAGEIVAGVVGKNNEIMGWVAGGLVALVLYWTLIKVLFNLDAGETVKLVFTIYLVRRWGRRLLFFVLTMAFFAGGAGHKDGDDEGSPGIERATPSAPDTPQEQAAHLNHDAEKALAEEKMFEARAWLKEDPSRTIYNLGPKAAETVESLYTMGAAKVSCGATAEGDGGKIAVLVIVELPADPEARAKLIDWANTTEKTLNGEEAETFKDVGQKYVTINYDNS
jgi:hypothetical protein